jgi:hypothetical protein
MTRAHARGRRRDAPIIREVYAIAAREGGDFAWLENRRGSCGA